MPTPAIILVLISTFMHAGWNMVLRWQRTDLGAFQILLVVGAVGLGPALGLEVWGTPFPPAVWGYLAVTGIFQAVYYVGLVNGYRHGHFTVVYPIARALPVLLVAVADVIGGSAPSPPAWLGMVLVSAGCIVSPLESLRGFQIGRYWNRVMVWIVITALGTVGYTIVDNAAAGLLEPGPLTAARYGIFEFLATLLYFGAILIGSGQPMGELRLWAGWKWPAIAALGMFGAYWLVLWSYQLSPQTSYVVALRQFSIVIGVVIGAILFREPAPGLRIGAAVTIAIGIALIVLAG